MLDITVIILTYNEKLHLRRCLERLEGVGKRIVVVDCFSKDGTQDIAREMGAEVVEHEWPGNQAEQFNWALDNIKIDTEWVLRLDADEYLTEELKEEMKEKLGSLPLSTSAIVLPLGRAFMGRVLKHGIVNGVKMIRLFRYGKVRYEQRLMDEHLEVLEGNTVVFENKFIDDNLLSISKFTDKHNNYSSREAALLLDAEYDLTVSSKHENTKEYAPEVEAKRVQKAKYAKMPLFWRSLGYFVYRYVIKCGFLDGKEGFCWDFFQGLWYRMLVDCKVYECKKACGTDREAMKAYIAEHWGIKL